MNIPEEFGKYLLLKELREDSLGETFRAGKVGKNGIEQVVLLRVFNGPGIEGEKLAQRISGRAAVQQALKSPNIGNGVDLGNVRNFPYTAYDYISGKSLAALLAQAARLRQPIPADQGLLISERIALALAAAYETRVHEERVLHGFVVPQQIMVSNEGESRLLGFEAAAGLRELYFAGWRPEDLRPYIAPEAATGASVARSDDVYSLGAILFELLTGQRLPAGPGDFSAIIDGAVLAADESPLPAAIAALLKRTLVARDQRIPDALTWHKALAKLIIEGQYTSTTFNLAFFMHNLFREEIERESQEIEAEKKLELPQRGTTAQAPAAPAARATDAREAAGARETARPAAVAQVSPSALASPPSQPGGASKAPLWIGIAAVALLLLGGGGYWLFGRSVKRPAAASTTPGGPGGPAAAAAAGGTGTAHPDPAAAAAAKQADLQAQIQQMIEARSKEMEAKFKSQYDDQIKQLQGKLDETRKAAAEQEKLRVERAQAARDLAEQRPAQTSPAAQRETAAGQPAGLASTTTSGSGAAQPASGQVARQGLTASSQPSQRQIPSSSAAAPASTNPAAAAANESAPPAASAQPPAPQPPQQPQQEVARDPQVQVGDLVQPGEGVMVPKAVLKAEARYPTAARRLNRSANITIKVLVDEKGRVIQAERLGPQTGFGFEEAALDAARRTQFQPATKSGVRVKMWTSLLFEFKPER